MILVIIYMLKKRDKALRKKCNSTLVAICKTVGPHLMYFIFKEIVANLGEGMIRHVRNYTIWVLLDKFFIKKIECEQTFYTGCMDFYIIKLANCAIEEMFSEMQTEKDCLELKNKTKEIKVHKGCRIMEILG